MTSMDLGASSAKRATWRETDTRPLLQRIVASNPGANDSELFNLLWEEIARDEPPGPQWDYLRSITLYWFELAMRALRGKGGKGGKPRGLPPPEVETAKEQLKDHVEREAKIMLLNWPMPNGKTLGECTGDDCRKIGGWLTAIAERVPARKTVAAVLSERQVYGIWKKANK